MSVLEVSELVTGFPAGDGAPRGERIHVVDGVSLDLDAAETLALVGESGCGKSMTALSILRLVPRPGRVESGSVRLEGRDLLPLPVPEMRKVRGAEISMIFQEPMTSLNPVVRVGKQVVEAIRLHESVSARAARERTLMLFQRAGIPDAQSRLDAYPHQLSGGLKQRVMIAMALATRPRVLIADEPTTALDVTIQAQILELLRELKRDFGTAILLITHDIGVVNELADRVAVMYGGRVVEEGARVDVLGAPRHPYTQGLLRSMPGLAEAHERLAEIPGVVPPPDEWPPGCRFDTRCSRVLERCSRQAPEATRIAGGVGAHHVFCHAVADDLRRSG